jgi:hypothetical protein
VCVILTAYGCLLSSPARFRCPGRDRRWSARRVARFCAVGRRNRSELSGLLRALCALQASPCPQGASSAVHSGLWNRQHWWICSMGPPALVVLTTRAFQRAFFFRKKCPNPGFELWTCTTSWEHFPLRLATVANVAPRG